jgi:hypothetical protein
VAHVHLLRALATIHLAHQDQLHLDLATIHLAELLATVPAMVLAVQGQLAVLLLHEMVLAVQDLRVAHHEMVHAVQDLRVDHHEMVHAVQEILVLQQQAPHQLHLVEVASQVADQALVHKDAARLVAHLVSKVVNLRKITNQKRPVDKSSTTWKLQS